MPNALFVGQVTGRLQAITKDITAIRKKKRPSRADRQRVLLLNLEARGLIRHLQARLARGGVPAAVIQPIILAYLDSYQETIDFLQVRTTNRKQGRKWRN